MGVAVSGWPLARAVSRMGQLGVVSGTALAIVFLRRLQQGDDGGDLRRALDHFPYPEMVSKVLADYYVPGGKGLSASFKLAAMPTTKPNPSMEKLIVIANFVEVFLAKEGHNGVVGVNYLEKIQLPTLPSVFGAMLAGVDYVLMGAGIPRAIPGVLDLLSRGDAAKLHIDVEGALPGEECVMTFDPKAFCPGPPPMLKRPQFLGIVASATLAIALAKKSSGSVQGFVVEGPTAGGHNAPPRGAIQLNAIGEPIYGPRDVPDLEKIRALGLPFWLAGSYGSPAKIAEAIQLGAVGAQVGTAFAFCDESGIALAIKRKVLSLCRTGDAKVLTDPLASPTGFPFKMAQLENTLSTAEAYAARERICDLGYLRHLYRRGDGSVGYRCPAEPVGDFLKKGGALKETEGRKCFCNGLLATVGLEQSRSGGQLELPIVTAGDDITELSRFLAPGKDTYTAAEVLEYLLGPSYVSDVVTNPVAEPVNAALAETCRD